MIELLVPIAEDEQPAQRLINGITDLPFNPAETRITVLNVFEEFEVSSGEWKTIESTDFYDEENIPDVVAKSAVELSDQGYQVNVRREHGDPAVEIVELAHELDADAIVIAGRERSPVGKALLGSVSQSVLRSADRPVIFIPKNSD